MSGTIRKEILIPQSCEEVWEAITDSETLAEWMFPNDFAPQVGRQFTFEVPPNPQANFEGLVVRCTVLECEPPRRLAFSWTAGGLIDTRVTFELEAEGDETRLRLEHAGFDLAAPWGEQAIKGADFGWAKMLKQLVAVVTNADSQTSEGSSI